MEELPPLVPDLTAWFEALLARVAALEARSEQGGAAATAKAEAQDQAAARTRKTKGSRRGSHDVHARGAGRTRDRARGDAPGDGFDPRGPRGAGRGLRRLPGRRQGSEGHARGRAAPQDGAGRQGGVVVGRGARGRARGERSAIRVEGGRACFERDRPGARGHDHGRRAT